jgi:hypothetical protein
MLAYIVALPGDAVTEEGDESDQDGEAAGG